MTAPPGMGRPGNQDLRFLGGIAPGMSLVLSAGASDDERPGHAVLCLSGDRA